MTVSGVGSTGAPRKGGVLVLIAGPSGAGKDTLIAGAREALAGDDRFHFTRRIITRAADAGAVEQHRPVSRQDFRAEAAVGGFLLAWHAHDTDYAIPGTARMQLSDGRIVVANVSRSVITAADDIGYPVAVVIITAPPSILAERLAARGRERADEIASRLQRGIPAAGMHGRLIEIMNDGTPEAGIDRLVTALKGLSRDL